MPTIQGVMNQYDLPNEDRDDIVQTVLLKLFSELSTRQPEDLEVGFRALLATRAGAFSGPMSSVEAANWVASVGGLGMQPRNPRSGKRPLRKLYSTFLRGRDACWSCCYRTRR